jgi:DNA-binding FrmR family transcriptional regulator
MGAHLTSWNRPRIDGCTSKGYHPRMMTSNANNASDQVAVIDAEQSELVEDAPKRTSTSYAHDKAKILARLRRMEGQVRGVQRMVEGDEYCLDVLTQLSAIIAAARQTGLLVLEDHVRGCVAGAWQEGASDEHREEMMTELMGAIDRFGRSVG